MNYNQEPRHISNFKKGDIITRINPVEETRAMGDLEGNLSTVILRRDHSGVGKSFEYMGILNGGIRLKIVEKDFTYKKGEIVTYDYWVYENGWAYYISPEELDLDSKTSDSFLENLLKSTGLPVGRVDSSTEEKE